MQVNFYGTYRPIAGSKTVEFNLDRGSTVRQLIDAIVTRFPPLRSELLDAHGKLHTDVPLYLNGRNPRLLIDGMDTILQPDDVLSVFSPIASGRLNVEDIKHAAAT